LSRNLSAVDAKLPEIKGEGKKIYPMKSSREPSITSSRKGETSLSKFHQTDNKGTGVNMNEINDPELE